MVKSVFKQSEKTASDSIRGEINKPNINVSVMGGIYCFTQWQVFISRFTFASCGFMIYTMGNTPAAPLPVLGDVHHGQVFLCAMGRRPV